MQLALPSQDGIFEIAILLLLSGLQDVQNTPTLLQLHPKLTTFLQIQNRRKLTFRSTSMFKKKTLPYHLIIYHIDKPLGWVVPDYSLILLGVVGANSWFQLSTAITAETQVRDKQST